MEEKSEREAENYKEKLCLYAKTFYSLLNKQKKTITQVIKFLLRFRNLYMFASKYIILVQIGNFYRL